MKKCTIDDFINLDEERITVAPLGTETEAYEQVVRSTCNYGTTPNDFLKLSLALAGEVGEFAGAVKKVKGFDFEQSARLADELGDVLYYTTALLQKLGFDLDAILSLNAEKVLQRKREGSTYNLPPDATDDVVLAIA